MVRVEIETTSVLDKLYNIIQALSTGTHASRPHIHTLTRPPTMSSAPPPNPNPNSGDNKPDDAHMTPAASSADADKKDEIEEEPVPEPEDTFEDIPEDVRNAPVEDINTRTRLIDNDIKVSSQTCISWTGVAGSAGLG